VRRNNKKILRAVRFALIAVMVVMLALFLRGHQKMTIPEGDQSLSPTYPGGSLLYVQPVEDDDPLEREMDVVYVQHKEGVDYARYGRIRGLAGDEIGAESGRVTVNGELVGPIRIPGKPAGVVPDGHLYILAVNPGELRYPDSRVLGFVARSDIEAIILSRIVD